MIADMRMDYFRETRSSFGWAIILANHRERKSTFRSDFEHIEPRVAAAVDRIQDECANRMGSVLGRPVAGLEPLASSVDFCSARHGGPLARRSDSHWRVAAMS